MDADTIAEVIAGTFGDRNWPSPFRRFSGNKSYLHNRLLETIERAPVAKGDVTRTRLILGSLILGAAAEQVFETKYRERLSTAEMNLIDLRSGRNDTDYRLVNGQGRPVYRINIKFHGSLFRNAEEVVGLLPEDCFPLATYKIDSALRKQDEEHLPYIFVIVTGSDISAESIGATIPEALVLATHYGKLMISTGKRALEESIVQRFVAAESAHFAEIAATIRDAKWFVLSARRAEEVMKKRLFERVFALRTRSFNRAYRNAEIDMHLSFSEDMTRLDAFLEMIATEGHIKLAGMLERGTI